MIFKIFKLETQHLSKTYKIITFLGLKLEFKVRNKCRLPLIHTSYRRKLEAIKTKLKRREKIRVLFLIRETSKWSYNSVFKEMLKSDIFEPIVAVSILTSAAEGKDMTRNDLEISYAFFKNLKYPVVRAYEAQTSAYLDLADFKPDLVFYDQPWELPAVHNPQTVSKFALTAYCDYGFEIMDYENYSKGFHLPLYKYFVDNKKNIERYQKYDKGNIKNCVSLGYPRLDFYLDKTPINVSKYWKHENKYKIIYAPHHSFEDDGLQLATFKENGKFILDLARKYQEETTWIFKPHPRFKYALLANQIMTEQEIADYYTAWADLGTIYEQGNYYDIFKSSDLMITDCCSFLAEYLPSQKPILQLVNPRHKPFTPLGEEITSQNYKAYSCEDIKRYFEELALNKNDYLQEKRSALSTEIIDFNITSAAKIVAYLKDEFKGAQPHAQ